MSFTSFIYRKRKKIYVFLADFAIFHVAFFVAMLVTQGEGLDRNPLLDDTFWIRYGLCIIVTSVCLLIFNAYSTLLRYVGRLETLRLALAYFVAFLVLLVMGFSVDFISLHASFGYPYILTSFALSVLFRFTPWLATYILHIRKGENGQKRAIIYGAGSAGMFLITQCISDPNIGYLPVAVIDDNAEKHGQLLSGVEVAGGREELGRVIASKNAEIIIIAIQNIKRSALKELYTECIKHRLSVKIMQTVDGNELNHGVTLSDINIESLLGRDEFTLNTSLVNDSVQNKTVLITGGAGSIGSELCRQSLEYNCKHLIIYDMHENGMFDLDNELSKKYAGRYTLVIGNIRDVSKLNKTFSQFKPDIVFHAAAYKHVPMMELNPIEAIKTNVFGTRNVIDACENYNAGKFILISTDKAVNPANVMGASKRIAEMILQSRGSKSKVKMGAVRFGNVVGSSGSAIPFFLKQISAGGPVTVTHRDIKRYFMTIPEAVRLVLQAGAFATSGEVFVLDMGEAVSIYTLAEDLIKMSGYTLNEISIDIVGLRPGEKLFEELRFDNETVDKTSHEGIFVTKMQSVNASELNKSLQKLEKYAQNENEQSILQQVFELVPSVYRENNNG